MTHLTEKERSDLRELHYEWAKEQAIENIARMPTDHELRTFGIVPFLAGAEKLAEIRGPHVMKDAFDSMFDRMTRAEAESARLREACQAFMNDEKGWAEKIEEALKKGAVES